MADLVLPIEFARLDPEVMQRLHGITQTIIDNILQRLNRPRPTDFAEELHFQNGTMPFHLLHEFADNDQLILYLFNSMLERIKYGDGRTWWFSLADPMVYTPRYKRAVTLALHPEDIDTTALHVVPPEVRIFCCNRQQPYSISELAPLPAAVIANKRASSSDLDALAVRWYDNRAALHGALLRIVSATLAARRDKLPSGLVRQIDDLLIAAVRSDQTLDELLQAASYLGLWGQITSGLQQVE